MTKTEIKWRTMPVDSYGDAPENLPFIEWTADDACEIEYSFHDSAIGRLLTAGTPKGLCFLGLVNGDPAKTLADMVRRFPRQSMKEGANRFGTLAVEFCNGNRAITIPLHVRGTAFQTGVWRQLVRIPHGGLTTYASFVPDGRGARAVGSAVGANPVSYIIPCHRVVRSDGSFNGYHWGPDIKRRLLNYELAAHNV